MQPLFTFLILVLICPALFGQTTNHLAPGAPGLDAHWPSAAKNGFGTSNTLNSKIWFTLTGGVLTEVFYPTLDVPNTQTLEFIVCRNEKCASESEELIPALSVLGQSSLSFQQLNRSPNGSFTITKTYTTDPDRPTVLIDVSFAPRDISGYTLYVYYDPSLNNSGLHDTCWNTTHALLASDGNVTSALMSSAGFADINNGFAGASDGLAQLRNSGRLERQYQRAVNGNVVQLARIAGSPKFTIALGFGASPREAMANAEASLRKGFARAQREYDAGWQSYISSLRRVELPYRAQFNMAAMVLKALEDKTYRGAMIASPSNPWGAGPNANEPNTTGYHAVWSRDLYHVATAFVAMGDRASAGRALEYLFTKQQKPDGSFPQNSRVDGRPIGNALQMDQVAFPILLAYQLDHTGSTVWRRHIKPAADFILKRGPATEQERWEEESGYSPGTMAAQIAGLVCAAKIATLHQDNESAKGYLKKADEWLAKLDELTASANGPHAPRPYYLRITQDQDPNDADKIEISSNGGDYDEREIVDAGFLELVRLGIKRADDPLVTRSLAVIDQVIKVETPKGSAWYRYNHDAYGERADGGPYDGKSGKGRLWPLLTGERGQFELARGDRSSAQKRLNTLMGFANDGRMIPEQVWDRADSPKPGLRFGEGTGAATPLAWSMAQFARLATNLQLGSNLETPVEVSSRYSRRSVNQVR